MFSARYHLGSFIAVFVALGVGTLIGATLGTSWIDETEHRILSQLMRRYEEQLAQNRDLRHQLESVQTLHKPIYAVLKNKKIVCYGSSMEESGLLPAALKFAGAEIVAPEENGKAFTNPDFIIIADKGAGNSDGNAHALLNKWGSRYPKGAIIVYVKEGEMNTGEPEHVLQFVQFLKKIAEENTHEAFGYYRYPGVE